MVYYEILEDGTIGRSTNNIKVAKLNNYYNENNITFSEEDIIVAYDNKRYLKGTEPEKPQELIEKEQNEIRRLQIQERLSQLSQDFVQAMAGAYFEDFETRKAEFQTLHNELRVLEGKEPRVYVN